MSNAFRMWSIALGLSVMAAGSRPLLETSTGPHAVTADARAPIDSPRYVAVVSTDWLPAPEARREIEQRSVELDRVAQLYGTRTRMLDTRQVLRVRSSTGARLEQPLAQFERSFEIRSGGTAGNAAALGVALRELGARAEPAHGDQLALQSPAEVLDSQKAQF